MGIYEKICLEMMDKIESLALSGDTDKILQYIDKKREQVEKCRSVSNDERQIH